MPVQFNEPLINGFKTRIYTAGQSATTAVVFVHGNPGPSNDWHDSLKAVSTFAYAIAPDMPGFGFSDRSMQFDATVDGYANHLGAVIDHLKLDRVHLVLHDFGGGWGLSWAVKNPDKVASICVVNCGIFRDYRWHWVARIWRTPLIGELFQLSTTRLALKFTLNSENPVPFPDEFIDRVWAHADWAHRKTVLKLYRSTDPEDMEEQANLVVSALGSRQIPGLVIWGKQDPYLDVRYADLQDEYMHCERLIMEGCGHWPMVDKPQEFVAALVAYLKRVCTAVQ